jgi:hypothetical protein
MDDKQIRLVEHNEPEVTIVRNKYLSANSIVIEEVTKKTWILPLI